MTLYPVIAERLYLRGSFKGLPTARKLHELQRHKISAVICTLRAADQDLRNLPWLEYYVMPVPDAAYVDEGRAQRAADQAVECIRRGRVVLVHCVAGRNRSALVSALAFRQVYGVSGAEAFAVVKRVRPAAFANPVFELYMQGLLPPRVRIPMRAP